jgi:hypothetical protein
MMPPGKSFRIQKDKCRRKLFYLFGLKSNDLIISIESMTFHFEILHISKPSSIFPEDIVFFLGKPSRSKESMFLKQL